MEELEAFALSLKILEVSIGTIYFLNDLTGDIVINDMVPFKELVDRFNREGAAVIYLTRPQLVEMKLISDDKLFADGLNWRQMVSSAQAAVKFETKKSSTKGAETKGS